MEAARKVARFFRFVTDFSKDTDFPRVVNYEITSRCNLNCSHCYWRKSLKSDEELSDREWGEIFREHRSRGATFAFITGGEPVLRPEVIEMADRTFPGLAIASNGTVRIPDHIRRRLFISLDGPREVHNRIRGMDVYDKVLDNIRGDSRVIISPTLSTSNRTCIEELTETARRTGVRGISFSLYTSHTNGDDPNYLKGELLDETIARLRATWEKNRDIVFLTPHIINTLKNKDHRDKCYFKGKHFVSYDARLNKKIPCVLGEGVNCSTCGCIVPVVSFALSKVNIRSYLMLNRMFPAGYFKNGDNAGHGVNP